METEEKVSFPVSSITASVEFILVSTRKGVTLPLALWLLTSHVILNWLKTAIQRDSKYLDLGNYPPTPPLNLLI